MKRSVQTINCIIDPCECRITSKPCMLNMRDIISDCLPGTLTSCQEKERVVSHCVSIKFSALFGGRKQGHVLLTVTFPVWIGRLFLLAFYHCSLKSGRFILVTFDPSISLPTSLRTVVLRRPPWPPEQVWVRTTTQDWELLYKAVQITYYVQKSMLILLFHFRVDFCLKLSSLIWSARAVFNFENLKSGFVSDANVIFLAGWGRELAIIYLLVNGTT